ncbi:PBS lyase HEAT-like repeat-containing protein [Thermodesulfovibrio aggregans]|uniref:PBS lyase HEAT-like repeat-containing protein n=1 Tax=Thermodesulfovibrio aggregans TaxID=86166 RepID=A0A0U9HQA4_9BACT|nr:HEAT repeat domain-containing protein [Thermodesulfovibrio aggregans]GAQ95214.1 PBS lyase HEAT-like repeat-containing protein [Thermodesulfovibrio aggregans]
MKFVVKLLILAFLLIPCTNSYSLTIDELLKELDVPHWREKISDPAFVEKFKTSERLSTVIDLANARGYDWRYRIRAIRLLGNIGTPQAKEALLQMFQDPFFHHECPSLKSYVADALGDCEPSRRLLEILKEGLKDAEILVREATAKSLGRLKMREAVEYLKEAFLMEKALAVRIAIVNALKSINTPEAKDFIKKIASDGNHRELIDAFGGSL